MLPVSLYFWDRHTIKGKKSVLHTSTTTFPKTWPIKSFIPIVAALKRTSQEISFWKDVHTPSSMCNFHCERAHAAWLCNASASGLVSSNATSSPPVPDAIPNSCFSFRKHLLSFLFFPRCKVRQPLFSSSHWKCRQKWLNTRKRNSKIIKKICTTHNFTRIPSTKISAVPEKYHSSYCMDLLVNCIFMRKKFI